MLVSPANNPEDVFWYLSNNPTLIGNDTWYLQNFQCDILSNVYHLRFRSTDKMAKSITIMEEQLVSVRDLITLIRETLRSSIVGSMKQPIGARDTYASVKPAGRNPNRNPNIATISAETTAGIATTSSNQLTINTVRTTINTVNNQGENKMDVKMFAYVAANMDKVTNLIEKWGTETAWKPYSVIMIDYTYSKDVVFKKSKVVDSNGEELKVYTATVFKAKNDKWYSSLQNNRLHGVEFGDVINFFENEVTIIKAVVPSYNNGTVFISNGKSV